MPNTNIGTTIIIMFLLGGLIFIVPMVTLTGRVDDVAQKNVDLIVQEYVTDLTTTGVLTRAKYENFEADLVSTGNVYDIEMEFHILDENPGQKTAQANYKKIGENVYVVYYNSQILPTIGINVGTDSVETTNDKFVLTEGSFVVVKVTSQNPTSNQSLESSFLNISNSDVNAISSQASGMCTVNGVIE